LFPALYTAHLDIHSFPTRRSSDLAMACGTPVIAFQRGSVKEVIDFGKTGFYADSMRALITFVPRALALDRGIVRDHARQRFGNRSEEHRLNSSHVKISYAVFCLKK